MLDSVDCDATVVIGEGERDEAPMLYIGEKVGTGKGAKLEIALDPLEGTTICAHGGPNSISVMAIGEAGNLLHAPDTYMLKLAAGPEARGKLDIRQTPTENLKRLADIKKCRVADLTAIVLDRPRHKELIDEIKNEISQVSDAIKNKQYGSAALTIIQSKQVELQNLLNKFLERKGIITPMETTNTLNSISDSKKARLEKDFAKGISNTTLIGIGVVVLGVLAYIYLKKK
jgi:fructose-1,6-bisphosphatase/sedoheptulose 1,7-bisphosphatase-like protein